jgi:hypothetical protein
VDKMEASDASLFPRRSSLRAFAQTEGRLFGRRFPFSSSDDSKNARRARSVVPSSL